MLSSPRTGWRSLNEVIGLLALPVLVLSALSGAAIWVLLAVRPSWTPSLITAHAYVGLLGLGVVLAKTAVGTAAWRRRSRRERTSPARLGQHALTALLVVDVLVLFGSGAMLNLNVTPGGGGTYKTVHLYTAIAAVALVAQHLYRHLGRAGRVVTHGVLSAPPSGRGASRRHVLVAGGLGLVAWGSLRTTGTALAGVGEVGPNDFPITLTAGGSDQPQAATWRLEVVGDVAQPFVVDLADLRAADQTQARYSLDCVTGWSATRTWGGVSLRDLLERAQPTGELLSAVFLSTTGYEVALLRKQLDDPRTLVALQTDGVDLTPEHGFPARVMAPGVVGEKCLKWVERITVVCA